MHIIVNKIKVMKKLTLRMTIFLAFGMFMYSCSVERNSITRGSESSYGIGSGLAVKNKNKHHVYQTGSAEISIVEAEQQLATSAVVSVVQENVFADKAKSESATGDRAIFASNKNDFISNIAVKTERLVNKVAHSEKSMKSPLGKSATKGESKSWYLTLFLCSMFGLIGLHRVYLGYSWQAWVQLLTLGGLGIWTFIDFIRIILKKLEPRCGIYEDI